MLPIHGWAEHLNCSENPLSPTSNNPYLNNRNAEILNNFQQKKLRPEKKIEGEIFVHKMEAKVNAKNLSRVERKGIHTLIECLSACFACLCLRVHAYCTSGKYEWFFG